MQRTIHTPLNTTMDVWEVVLALHVCTMMNKATSSVLLSVYSCVRESKTQRLVEVGSVVVDLVIIIIGQ